ncbi:MAG: DUF2167 domain-containing protein [Gammaproteobacteria bacterium]|nr:DUF2167 domain-containing protein [Gammaproteobacteria bacterium]
MDRQTGKIELPGNIAYLDVPENFYYLNPEDTATVLTEFWGNPPAELPMLGMLFPSEYTPFDETSWGVTIEYVQDGYVSDDDAADIDYNDLLESMQDDTREESKERVKAGYESISLVGWAAQPRYDAESHKLYWAQELKFGDIPVNTLNYNIRALGRQGYLVLNFIAGIDQLDEINDNLDTVMNMTNFNPGATYDDFDPSVDEVAAYGLGALVAGKLLAKGGFLAALLLILKKFGVFIIAGIAALFTAIFKRKK